jgi:hypothetical protein
MNGNMGFFDYNHAGHSIGFELMEEGSNGVSIGLLSGFQHYSLYILSSGEGIGITTKELKYDMHTQGFFQFFLPPFLSNSPIINV